MKRRALLKTGGAALALGAASAAQANSDKVINWKLVMTWPKNYPGMGTSVQWFADEVRRLSKGRLNITVYGAGELVPAFEVFNAVADGTAEMGHGPAYYWKGKIPPVEIFTSVPFGMTPVELSAWFYEGGGIELLNECYKPFGVVAFPGGNCDFQMGGWFKKEINSLEDLKGLKMRVLGVAGEVYKKAGVAAVSMPGSETFTSMQSGVIEAADWVGPWHDQAFGLHKVAKYYYGSWQEPGAACELMINEKAFASLPEELRAQVETAMRAASFKMLTECRAQNARALNNLIKEHGVEQRYFPDEVLKVFKQYTQDYLQEYAARDALSKKIYDSYSKFMAEQRGWAENERRYLSARDVL